MRANHQSFYDIPILFWTLPHQLRIIAKASLGRVPVHRLAPASRRPSAGRPRRTPAPASLKKMQRMAAQGPRSSSFPRAPAPATAAWAVQGRRVPAGDRQPACPSCRSRSPEAGGHAAGHGWRRVRPRCASPFTRRFATVGLTARRRSGAGRPRRATSSPASAELKWRRPSRSPVPGEAHGNRPTRRPLRGRSVTSWSTRRRSTELAAAAARSDAHGDRGGGRSRPRCGRCTGAWGSTRRRRGRRPRRCCGACGSGERAPAHQQPRRRRQLVLARVAVAVRAVRPRPDRGRGRCSGWAAPGEAYAGIRKDAVHLGGRLTLVDDAGPVRQPDVRLGADDGDDGHAARAGRHLRAGAIRRRRRGTRWRDRRASAWRGLLSALPRPLCHTIESCLCRSASSSWPPAAASGWAAGARSSCWTSAGAPCSSAACEPSTAIRWSARSSSCCRRDLVEFGRRRSSGRRPSGRAGRGRRRAPAGLRPARGSRPARRSRPRAGSRRGAAIRRRRADRPRARGRGARRGRRGAGDAGARHRRSA